jgi:hypothetical protein
MTDHRTRFLGCVAEGRLLFHTGLWGGPAGYRWCGPDGNEAGLVSPWETEMLDQLVYRGLIRVEPCPGPAYRRVVTTPAGLAALDAAAKVASAA